MVDGIEQGCTGTFVISRGIAKDSADISLEGDATTSTVEEWEEITRFILNGGYPSTYTFKDYSEVFKLAKEIGCKPKEMCATFNTFEQLKHFVESFDKDFHEEIEGFVFVDQNNFMIKYKTPFYKFWKDMRRMKEYINKGDSNKYFAAKNVNSEQTDLMNSLFEFMTNIKNSGIDLDTLSIIDIRNSYYNKN